MTPKESRTLRDWVRSGALWGRERVENAYPGYPIRSVLFEGQLSGRSDLMPFLQELCGMRVKGVRVPETRPPGRAVVHTIEAIITEWAVNLPPRGPGVVRIEGASVGPYTTRPVTDTARTRRAGT